MSTRYEGAGAENIVTTVAMPGDEVGDDEVPAGELALLFNYDEVFVLQGTPSQLRELLHGALEQIAEAEAGLG